MGRLGREMQCGVGCFCVRISGVEVQLIEILVPRAGRVGPRLGGPLGEACRPRLLLGDGPQLRVALRVVGRDNPYMI